jgi:hypothetical protein
MTDFVTRIEDIVEPEVFVPYVIQRTVELSELVASGIIVPDEQMDILAKSGGRTVNMPFFNDLTGDDEVISDTTPLSTAKIGSDKDVARIHFRAKAWSVNELAAAVAGADPMAAIADLVAKFWVRREQAIVIASLKGVFADNVANDSLDLVHRAAAEATADVVDWKGAAPTVMNPIAIIDATQKLGDQANMLTSIAMHSKPFGDLLKQELIEFVQPSGLNVKIPYYMGKRVLVDDTMPTRSGTTSGTVYQSFLFAQGAIARGEGMPAHPVEMDRDALQGDDILITRRYFLLHPRGIKWTDSSVAGASPDNTELATAANWNRVYERKAIRFVMLETN